MSFYSSFLFGRYFSSSSKQNIKDLSGIRIFSNQHEYSVYSNLLTLLKSEQPSIYAWVNNINGKCYIGSSTNLYERFLGHYHGYSSNKILQASIRKNGISNFSFIIIESLPDAGDNLSILLNREQYYQDNFIADYNLSTLAGSAASPTAVYVFSLSGKFVNSFPTLNAAAAHFGVYHRTIYHYLVEGAVFKNNYILSATNSFPTNLNFRGNGVRINLIDLNDNLVYRAESFNDAARWVGVTPHSIKTYLLSGNVLLGLIKVMPDFPFFNEFSLLSDVEITKIQAMLRKAAYKPKLSSIQIYDSTSNELLYTASTITDAVKYLSSTIRTVRPYINSGKIFKSRFILRQSI